MKTKELIDLLEIKPINEEQDAEEYDRPNKSKWLIGVDHKGYIFLLKTPNIHPYFLDYDLAENLGLPKDTINLEPGVYEVTCAFTERMDWESGLVDDYSFDILEATKLFELPK